jgi:hypothetical protein
MEKTETTDMEKGQRESWMDQENGNRRRSAKGNIREKIRRGGHKQKKITKTAKVRVLY